MNRTGRLFIGIGAALFVLAPLAEASHISSEDFQCDGGHCADGETHSLDCRTGRCVGDAHGFSTISHPAFDHGQWLQDDDPVLGVAQGSDARAYPLRILYWFETANDTLDGTPILVSFCPLCWSGIIHQRNLNGRELVFLNTGAIWKSDLVVYDKQTGSWWTQIGGEALTGPLHGSKLHMLDANQVSWKTWREAHPGTRVLARPVDESGRFLAPYDRAPVRGVDDLGLGPETRVHGVVWGAASLAFPVPVLEERLVGHARVGSLDVVAAYVGGDVVVWRADGHRFRPGAEQALERDDGQRFDAVTGMGAHGGRLERVAGSTMFLFAWHNFHPETETYDAGDDPPWWIDESVPGAPGAAFPIIVAAMAVAVWLRRP